MAALADEVPQFVPECFEVSDLAFNLLQVLAGDAVHGVARLVAIVGELEQVTHLVEREPEVSGAPNEAEPFQMLRSVGPIVA